MDTTSLSFWSASLRDDISTIDLHDVSSLGTAEDELEQALFSFAKAGDEACRVVHGIGNGTMKTLVHAILEKNPLVEDFQLSSDGGSTLVLLSPIQ